MVELTEPPSVAALGSESVPSAVVEGVTVTVSVWPMFLSVIVTFTKGATVDVSGVIAPVLPAPKMVGATATSVATTLVVASLAVAPAASVTLMVKPVVTVWPGATWLTRGMNTSPSTAAATCAAVPLTV